MGCADIVSGQPGNSVCDSDSTNRADRSIVAISGSHVLKIAHIAHCALLDPFCIADE